MNNNIGAKISPVTEEEEEEKEGLQWENYGIQTENGIEMEFLVEGGLDQFNKIFDLEGIDDSYINLVQSIRSSDIVHKKELESSIRLKIQEIEDHFELIFQKIDIHQWGSQEEYREWYLEQVRLLDKRVPSRSSVFIEGFKKFKSMDFNWISGEVLNRTLFKVLRKNDLQAFIIDNILKNEVFFRDVSDLLRREREAISSLSKLLETKTSPYTTMIYFDIDSNVVRLKKDGFTSERSITISDITHSNNSRTESLKNYRSSGRLTKNLGFTPIHSVGGKIVPELSIGNILNSFDPVDKQIKDLEKKIQSVKLVNHGDFFLTKFNTFKFVLECNDIVKRVRHFPKIPKNLRISEESNGFIRINKEFKLKNSWKDFFSNCKLGSDGTIIPLEKLDPEDEIRISFKKRKFEFIGRFPLIWNLIGAPLGLIREVFCLSETTCSSFHSITKDHIVVLSNSDFELIEKNGGKGRLMFSQFRLEKIDSVFNTDGNFFPGVRDPQIQRQKIRSALVVKPLFGFDHEIVVLLVDEKEVEHIEKRSLQEDIIQTEISTELLEESFEKLSLIPYNEPRKLQIPKIMNEGSSDFFNIIPVFTDLSLTEKSEMTTDDILSKHFFSRSSRIMILHWWILGTFINLVRNSGYGFSVPLLSSSKNQEQLNSVLVSSERYSSEKLREISSDARSAFLSLKKIIEDYPFKLDIILFFNKFYEDNVLWEYFIQFKATDEQWKIFTNDLISFKSEMNSRNIRWIMDIVKSFREVYEKTLSTYAKRMEKAVMKLTELPTYTYPYVIFPWKYSVKIISDAFFTIELYRTYITYDFLSLPDSKNIEIATIELMKLIGLSVGFYRQDKIKLDIDVVNRNTRVYFSGYLGGFTPEEMLGFCLKNYLKYELNLWYPNIFICSEILRTRVIHHYPTRETFPRILSSIGQPIEGEDEEQAALIKQLRGDTESFIKASKTFQGEEEEEQSGQQQKKQQLKQKKKPEKPEKTGSIDVPPPSEEFSLEEYLLLPKKPDFDTREMGKIKTFFQFSYPDESSDRYLEIYSKRVKEPSEISVLESKRSLEPIFREVAFNVCIFDKIKTFLQVTKMDPEKTKFIEIGMRNSAFLCTIGAMFNFRKTIGLIMNGNKNTKTFNSEIKNILDQVQEEEVKKEFPFLKDYSPSPDQKFFDNPNNVELINIDKANFYLTEYITDTEPGIVFINSMSFDEEHRKRHIDEAQRTPGVKLIVSMDELKGKSSKRVGKTQQKEDEPRQKEAKEKETNKKFYRQSDLNYKCEVGPISNEFSKINEKWSVKVLVNTEFKKDFKTGVVSEQRMIKTAKGTVTRMLNLLKKEEEISGIKLSEEVLNALFSNIEKNYSLIEHLSKTEELKKKLDPNFLEKLNSVEEEEKEEAIQYFKETLKGTKLGKQKKKGPQIGFEKQVSQLKEGLTKSNGEGIPPEEGGLPPPEESQKKRLPPPSPPPEREVITIIDPLPHFELRPEIQDILRKTFRSKNKERLLGTMVLIGTCFQYSLQFFQVIGRISKLISKPDMNLKIRLVTGYDREVTESLFSLTKVKQTEKEGSPLFVFNIIINNYLKIKKEDVISIDEFRENYEKYIGKDNKQYLNLFIGSVFDVLPLEFSFEQKNSDLYRFIFHTFSMNTVLPTSKLYNETKSRVLSTPGNKFVSDKKSGDFKVASILILPEGLQNFLFFYEDPGKQIGVVDHGKDFIQAVNRFDYEGMEVSGFELKFDEKELVYESTKGETFELENMIWKPQVTFFYYFKTITILDIFHLESPLIFESYSVSEIDKYRNAHIEEFKRNEEELANTTKKQKLEIGKLKKRISSMKEQEKSYKELSGDTKKLKERILELEKLRESDKEKLEESESQLEILQREKEELEQLSSTQNREKEELEEYMKELNEEIEKLRKNLDISEKKKSEFKSKLIFEVEKNILSEEEITELKEDLKEYEERIKTLYGDVNELKRERNELMNKYSSFVPLEKFKTLKLQNFQQLETSRSKIQSLQRKLEEQENELEKLRNLPTSEIQLERIRKNTETLLENETNDPGIILAASENSLHEQGFISQSPQTSPNLNSPPEGLFLNDPQSQSLESPEVEIKRELEEDDPAVIELQQQIQSSSEIERYPLERPSYPEVTQTLKKHKSEGQDLVFIGGPLTSMIHTQLATLPNFVKNYIDTLNRETITQFISNRDLEESRLFSIIIYISLSLYNIINDLEPRGKEGKGEWFFMNFYKGLVNPGIFEEITPGKKKQSFILLFYSVFLKIWLIDERRRRSRKEPIIDLVFKRVKEVYNIRLNELKTPPKTPIKQANFNIAQKEYLAIQELQALFSGSEFAFGAKKEWYSYLFLRPTLKQIDQLIVDESRGDETVFTLTNTGIKEFEGKILMKYNELYTKERPKKESWFFSGSASWFLSGSISNIVQVLDDYSKNLTPDLDKKEKSEETKRALNDLFVLFSHFLQESEPAKFYFLGFLLYYSKTEGKGKASDLITYIGDRLLKKIDDSETDSLLIEENLNRNVQSNELSSPASRRTDLLFQEPGLYQTPEENDLKVDEALILINGTINTLKTALRDNGFEVYGFFEKLSNPMNVYYQIRFKHGLSTSGPNIIITFRKDSKTGKYFAETQTLRGDQSPFTEGLLNALRNLVVENFTEAENLVKK